MTLTNETRHVENLFLSLIVKLLNLSYFHKYFMQAFQKLSNYENVLKLVQKETWNHSKFPNPSTNFLFFNKQYLLISIHDFVEKFWQPAIVICKMSKF